uniref:Uncharacterized protein n=1 Tax=Anguilla anguilla TaxID=7936 RepID=A0A0E9V0W2_ANGAN
MVGERNNESSFLKEEACVVGIEVTK